MRLRSSKREEFLRRPEFDGVSFRSWRRETLVRYDSANQSEPLRLVIFLLLTLSLAFSGALAEAVGAPKPEPAGAYYLGSVLAGGLFLRERSERTRKLVRLEREGQVGDLSLVIKKNVAVGGQQETTVRDLKKPLVAIYAPREILREIEATDLLPLRRRLEQADVHVVLVANEGTFQRQGTAVTEPGIPSEWLRTFRDLLTVDSAWDDFEFTKENVAYFALDARGRSCKSGQDAPNFSLLFATAFPPQMALSGPASALPEQASFYDALTQGDVSAMKNLFVQEDDVTLRGISTWEDQLGDARPSDLIVSDADVFFSPDGRSATTTAIETPDPRAPSNTLLAIQRWTAVNDTSSDVEWRLRSHTTAPFSSSMASAPDGRIIRCDHRGCALVSG